MSVLRLAVASLQLVALLIVGAASCARTAEDVAHGAAGTASAEPEPSISPTSPATASASVAAPAPLAERPLDEPSATIELPVDAAEWFTERGASRASQYVYRNAYGCKAVAVGTPQESALLCLDDEQVMGRRRVNPAIRVVTHARLFVVRAGKVQCILSLPVKVAQLDKVRRDEPDIVNARLTVDGQGMAVTLTDEPPQDGLTWTTCAAAETRLDAMRNTPDVAVLRHWRELDETLVREVCAARSVRSWVRGRFVLQPAP
jgi:hypothetical protein